MKTKILVVLLSSAAALSAAPLTETAAVHTKPETASPAVAYLKAGTEPVVAPETLATTPAGWMAVELPGPFEGYVSADGLTKSLDVRLGPTIHLAPKADAPVLTIMEKGDKAEITGLRGKWTQIRLDKKLTGYIRITAPLGASLPAIATAPATHAPALATASLESAPANVNAAGKPAPMVNLGDGGSAALPRLFQGKFVSTRRPFAPRRPYDYQINDESGVRIAYVDIGKLLQTEKIDRYLDHVVLVSGPAWNVPDAKGIVVQAESLQLK